jgi:hypothetical protein
MEQENDKSVEDTEPTLVEKVSEQVSTDVITDLKTGIYNLFLNLFHNNVVLHGPEEAMRQSLAFLQEIIDNFNTALSEEE